mmetsp:Transcript_18622/g.42566  ORF Transcript_18622/g.42566 Transcript_18622/m.42566 type:complete len:85 (+) Transcript_18622:138-392(+)
MYGEKKGVIYGPPDKECRKTCKSCTDCYENKKAKFFHKKKGSKLKFENCKFLKKNKNICSRTTTDPSGIYPLAKEICPKTCSIC